MHTLIVGERQVGKSTLIRRVLRELGCPVFGFETKKEDGLADETGGCPLYIYEAGKPRVRSAENLAGYCRDEKPVGYVQAFDRFAGKLTDPPPGCVVLMDELGKMEAASKPFTQAVMRLLDGDAPVIAAVKNKPSPFLDAVRNHPRCRCFYITEENRNELYEDVLCAVKRAVAQENE